MTTNSKNRLRRAILVFALGMIGAALPCHADAPPDTLADRRLAWAVCHNDVPTAKAALKAGADPKASFPLWQYLDFRADDPPTLTPKNTILKEVEAKQEPLPLIFAAGVDTVKVLVDAGADVNARDANGDTPLIFYASDRQLELDPDSDIGDQRSCDTQMLSALLKAGANANAHDNDGDTALHLIHNCLRNDGPGRDNPDEVVVGIRLLTRHGADVNAKNNAGQTVLQVTESSWGKGYTYGGLINATLKKLGARAPRSPHGRMPRKTGPRPRKR